MVEGVNAHIWSGRAVFFAVLCVTIFVQLVPFGHEPTIWAAPDVMLAITLAWVARRPDLAPFYIIVGLFLLTDLLFQRPPGLWALLVLLLTEFLRTRASAIRNMPLMLEWGTVAVGIVSIIVANRIILAIVMSPQAPLGLTLIQMLTTIAIYPVVLAVVHFAFGISRPAPGAVDKLGRKL